MATGQEPVPFMGPLTEDDQLLFGRYRFLYPFTIHERPVWCPRTIPSCARCNTWR